MDILTFPQNNCKMSLNSEAMPLLLITRTPAPNPRLSSSRQPYRRIRYLIAVYQWIHHLTMFSSLFGHGQERPLLTGTLFTHLRI